MSLAIARQLMGFVIVVFAVSGLISFGFDGTVFSWTDPDTSPRSEKAPIAASGDNIYIVWWTDKNTANSNGELMFRASTDGGQTFGDKINLSNTADADSVDAEIIASDEGSVIITWWERNATVNEPVAKVSTDNGLTFGPMLNLANNGPIENIDSGEE
jgi:hypothetical protein